jgi:hypothetical protein
MIIKVFNVYTKKHLSFHKYISFYIVTSFFDNVNGFQAKNPKKLFCSFGFLSISSKVEV